MVVRMMMMIMKHFDLPLKLRASASAPILPPPSLGKYDKKRLSDAEQQIHTKRIAVLAFLVAIIVIMMVSSRQRLKDTTTTRIILIPPPQPILATTTTTTTTTTAQQTQESFIVPNVLLVGAQKAGSTALAEWIYQNGVCRPNIFDGEPELPYNKEVHFFDDPSRFSKGLEFYSKRFEHCQTTTTTNNRNKNNDDKNNENPSISRLIMDATPDYLDLSKQIHSFYNQHTTNGTEHLKILMILREPVSRELSLYNHLKKLYLEDPNHDPTQWYATISKGQNNDIMTFDEHVAEHLVPCYKGNKVFMYSCTTGGYARQLKRWFDLFDRRTQILVLSYEELQEFPETALRRVEAFLEGTTESPSKSKTKYDSSLLTRINTQSSKAKVKLPSCVSQVRLSRIFAPWNHDLYRLLEEHPGPGMEQRPFPEFHSSECVAMKHQS